MYDRERLGRNIRRYRLERKPSLTQEQLAAKLQARGHATVSIQRISEMELGTRSVKAEELVSLARVLHVTITTLLGVPDYADE